MEDWKGLWQKESKKGNTYYTGSFELGKKKLVLTVIKNEKTKETQPDLRFIVRDFEEKTKSTKKSEEI